MSQRPFSVVLRRCGCLDGMMGCDGELLCMIVFVTLLMAEILLHLGCIKPCKYWDIYHINWCRISSINSMKSYLHMYSHSIVCYPIAA